MSEPRDGGPDHEPEATEGRQPADADPFEGLVLDEEFIKGAKQSEPSARARMLAERWKNEPPEDTGFREAAGNRGRRRLRRRPTGGNRAPRRLGGGRTGRRDRTDLKIAIWFVLIAAVILFLSARGG
ncbi:hypothetical protein LO772_23255 [Yinghuangia sp. ASG 101]|uniref:SCO2583/SCO2584 N-terminal domain-containing protein n=1 Tax=Yinghuangia sp. ASG 101 TaxID=2896848 RepID=UPI001E4E9FFC|nr:hypothetical protein [Yinghuangia sp. ASG 101]UGQ09810.1 hypothetical protein LO772_23255 [Yinghuangia sp. ASG 101]